jgi:hypothetical protein
MKISKADVDKMIKEEFQKMIGKKKLTSKLSQINEELNRMDQEDANLEEVEAGGLKKTMSDTGLEGGGKQHAVNFTKKGSSLMEDEDEMEVGMDNEMGEETPMGEFEAKFAEIGKAIDAKMNAGAVDMDDESGTDAIEVGGDAGAGEVEMSDDDDFEEVEVSDDDNSTEEVDEYAEVHGGEGAPQGMTADQALNKPVKESVDEPLEGHSVAQEASVDGVNDNMEKDTHVKESASKEGKLVTEAKKTEAKNIFTEGLDARKKTALLEEMNRMKKFAGLSRDED